MTIKSKPQASVINHSAVSVRFQKVHVEFPDIWKCIFQQLFECDCLYMPSAVQSVSIYNDHDHYHYHYHYRYLYSLSLSFKGARETACFEVSCPCPFGRHLGFRRRGSMSLKPTLLLRRNPRRTKLTVSWPRNRLFRVLPCIIMIIIIVSFVSVTLIFQMVQIKCCCFSCFLWLTEANNQSPD